MQSITEKLLDSDPVMEHYLKLKRVLDDVMLPYKKLHRNLRQSARQLTITYFFSALVHPPQDHQHPHLPALPLLPILHPLR